MKTDTAVFDKSFFVQFNYLLISVLATEKELKVADLRSHNIQLQGSYNVKLHANVNTHTHTKVHALEKKKVGN